MIETQDELKTIFQGTTLEHSEIVELSVLDTDEVTFALDIQVGELEEKWSIARSLADKTGRWPIVAAAWDGISGSLAKVVQNEEVFSRFYFEEAPDAEDVSPRALIEKSKDIDTQAFIDTLTKTREQYEDFDEAVDVEIERTKIICGTAPLRKEIEEAGIKTEYELDRWFLEWEKANGGLGNPEASRLDWFIPERVFLLLLPTRSSWETLAYVNWYGTSDYGSEHYIALGKSWEKRFGAELVAHYGTMLQCFVNSPPNDLNSAWDLATEHDLVAPCNLAMPGLSLRHYANGLVGCDRWVLHERP